MRLLVPALLASCLLAAAPAAAFEELAGELVAKEPCEAFASLRRQANPDAAKLAPGQRYRVLGRNRRDGEWLQVLLPERRPAERWVDEDCGTLKADGPPATGLRPFFDEVDAGRDDPAPPPPPLSTLDQAVLELCGPWGSRPKRQAFRARLDDPALAPAVARIFAAVQGGRGDLETFKNRLTDIWFARHAFAHVFCGEPRGDELGGLHYRGRYLELQEQGIAGLASPRECRANEVEPPVYTIGVRYRPPDGGPLRTACPKGYAYDLDAEALLTVATRASAALRDRRGEAMCLAQIGPYAAVVVAQDGKLRTFYPDITPRCDDGGRPASCACEE